MTEHAINERRNWKAEVFYYDHYLPDESKECLYCLTDKQVEILRGIVTPLGWRTRWWTNESEPIDKDTIEAFRDDIIRRLMMSCCPDDGQTRYRWTDDGILQRSDDGGVTFYDFPDGDPRVNSPQYPPPMEGDPEDLKCLGASSALNLIREQIGDNLTDDMSRFTLGELIETWVSTYVQTSNPFLALIQIAVNQILALTIAAVRVALTSGVYDKLICIFFNNILDDQSFDNTAWHDVRDDILDQISGIAGIFLEHIVFLLGSVGLTNIARAGAGDPDANCCPLCDLDNWQIKIFAGSPIGTEISRGVDFIEVAATFHPSFSQWVAQIQSNDDDTCCTLFSIEAISGDVDGEFSNGCGIARWPATEMAGIGSFPTDGNTYHCRNVSAPFTVKFHFNS